MDYDGSGGNALVRAAKITLWLCCDRQSLTTREVANRLNMTTEGVRYILNIISVGIPIFQDDDGKWKRC